MNLVSLCLMIKKTWEYEIPNSYLKNCPITTLYTAWMIIFNYLADFSYFPLGSSEKLPKVTGHSQNRSEINHLKRGCIVSAIFHWFSVILFYNQNHPCTVCSVLHWLSIWVWAQIQRQFNHSCFIFQTFYSTSLRLFPWYL